MGRERPQKESRCDGEMAQCVKYPQQKREHLSLDPQHRCKKPGLVAYSHANTGKVEDSWGSLDSQSSHIGQLQGSVKEWLSQPKGGEEDAWC